VDPNSADNQSMRDTSLVGDEPNGLEPTFPIEFFIVDQVPVSLSGSSRSRDRWKENVANSARMAIIPGSWATDKPISVTIFYFPDGHMQGDIDNIVKHILDAMKGVIYADDRLVERVWAQKFEFDRPSLVAENPSITLASALDFEPPVLYVRIDDDRSSET
jgi:crossover junction endodeoxyribonuclease RusA